jgi:membrane protein implicated in regulation of membrane protease activity
VTALWDALGPGWGWLVAGLVLMALELVAPGTVILWFGLAALGAGLLVLAFGIGPQAAWLAFAALSVAGLAVWWTFRKRERAGEDETLNERAARYVGRRFTLSEPIVGGEGRTRIDDSIWRIEGPDLPAGSAVLVTAASGAVLRVAAAGPSTVSERAPS